MRFYTALVKMWSHKCHKPTTGCDMIHASFRVNWNNEEIGLLATLVLLDTGDFVGEASRQKCVIFKSELRHSRNVTRLLSHTRGCALKYH